MKVKGQKLNFATHLHAVPVRNRAATEVESSDGRLVLELALEYKKTAKHVAKALKARESKKFELEGLGLEIFQLIDDKRTFEQLIDAFADEHSLLFFESRALIMPYLKTLVERGLVVLAVKNVPDEEAE